MYYNILNIGLNNYYISNTIILIIFKTQISSFKSTVVMEFHIDLFVILIFNTNQKVPSC